ncbi:similar to Saccharomyces cerevisiae YIL045W PIG2 Putative type-1 protein phosphatase targeting subunit that tethers Glc7p type-1 protein phosphatase to Gsy2p glycogen synthase [Maudiozyma saulgeensis]|uniref:Similar to Saccharomyces cerevisiae YIL045W PIG2 Putative type-1 protein phosphatase targeting subunit that tethers Glc7p type-1 protein phosphatase to Gsy2p glycogen synthase n=1 Tax=Maudiozyma saulgeensis TaxID=1789683 RepID=A0A1X7R2R2_9SACH|nr:similar to Saccharomyces cerevisiae YIL045W PIG2 Putative type-1 protein phosphatase targeting subunit that tethers Glc7p type-1 protein phosphatase to Gsy2p glycogen synthase [Kazachstania saulgeensis]
MYIKADCKKLGPNPNLEQEQKPLHERVRDHRNNFHSKLQQLPRVMTPSGIKEELDKYQTNLNSPYNDKKYHVLHGDSNLSSLKFLHKPQRVAHLNEDRFPEEELQRNTDMNKKLTTSNGLPELSPNSVVEERNIQSINYIFNNTSNESIIPFPTPVYKKSGELVKSSLKKRSKSLPATPLVSSHYDDDDDDIGENPLLLARSKSVHFDHKTPVKYFSKDESPINVNTTNEQNNILNFIHKPVNLMDSELGVEDDNGLLSGLKNMGLRDRFISLDNLSNKKNGNNEPKKLRKSRRFQKSIEKENESENENISNTSKLSTTRNIISKPISNPFTISSVSQEFNNSVEELNKKAKEEANAKNLINSTTEAKNKKKAIVRSGRSQKVVGLYNENFPILSNKNPKSLKLNIFINLSRGKKCFLQELTLHIQTRQNLSNGITQTEPHNTISRYIIGKVLVKNIYYDKRIIIRYTWDKWKTVSEVEAIWLSNSDSILPGTDMDIFHFLIDDNARNEYNIGKLEFCIQYTTRNDTIREEYWDNNDDQNYKVDVVLKGFNNPFSL